MKLFLTITVTIAFIIDSSIARSNPENQSTHVIYNHVPLYATVPAEYSFDWSVNDDYSNNHFGQTESKDGDKTVGSYNVLLPDGRTQKVTYSVDGDGGYVAEVTYEGEAKYPETPKYKPAPPPAYKPAPTPAYKPAPAPSYKPTTFRYKLL